MMTAQEIRTAFLNFFASKNHQIVSSAPLIVKNDPTLMFTNAGMNQFKDYFLGTKSPIYKCVANTQKCLRVSGKHNDLEDVGFDTYHHTMFEMLGNWSFGEYFKKETIAWAWELLTKVYKLDKNSLYVTVFEGDKKNNIPVDKEAFDYWKTLISPEKILFASKKDNFWEMGDTGPCGPCSEIHIDLRSVEERQKVDGKTLVNQDHPLVIEIWNLVFIQYNRNNHGIFEQLPEKHIDTGMGFERIIMAIQKKESNYDTDIFQPLIQYISNQSNYRYGQQKETDIAMRVIADHIRAITFAIADGQLPSNNKAGYVVRRILRRAVRYGYTFLNFKKPFLYKLVSILKTQFADVFPKINSQVGFIQKVIKEEEFNFLNTLEKGLTLLNQVLEDKKLDTKKLLEGTLAFQLYDTYGFPLDLTQLIAKEQNFYVDIDGFEICMKTQKERSRRDAKSMTSDWQVLKKNPKIKFLGYDLLNVDSQIIRVRKVHLKNKVDYQIVLNRTPFYAESGGQIGDKGCLIIDNKKINVLNTKKENELIIHHVDKLPDNLDADVACIVDKKRRDLTTINHSATHLLHASLRQILGKHVEQKGSLVSEKALRFDFVHFEKISDEDIKIINDLVNEKIREGIQLEEIRGINYHEALSQGAIALFGEKYSDKVRTITFDKNFSVELCGGTHVKNTHQIGFFKIISESSISAGVRRIQALTAQIAIDFVETKLKILNNISQYYKNPKDIEAHTLKILEQNNSYEKTIKKLEEESLFQQAKTLFDKVIVYEDKNAVFQKVKVQKTEQLRYLAFELRKQIKQNLFGVLVSIIKSKPYIIVVFSDDMQSKGFNANTIIQILAKLIDGRGGGQPFFAMAGGKKDNLKDVLQKAVKILKKEK